MDFEINTKGKGLFLTLSSITLIVLMAITTLLWYFISPRLHEVSSYLAGLILYALRIFYFIIISGIAFLYITCFFEKVFKLALYPIRISITFLFPYTIFVGKLMGISKDKIRESFVNVNNAFIKANKSLYYPEQILVLLPHCMQNSNCTFRITNDISNCRECGKCVIMNMKKIKEKYKVNVAIATGGTLARRIIVNVKPKFIIAIACQRDLVDGLLEVFPIPVYGLLNDRPEGPCINTTVDFLKIKDILDKILVKQ